MCAIQTFNDEGKNIGQSSEIRAESSVCAECGDADGGLPRPHLLPGPGLLGGDQRAAAGDLPAAAGAGQHAAAHAGPAGGGGGEWRGPRRRGAAARALPRRGAVSSC